MIGEHAEMPTRIFVAYHTYGDGQQVAESSIANIYASFDAAEERERSHRGGPVHIFECRLNDETGRYHRGLQWYRDRFDGQIHTSRWERF